LFIDDDPVEVFFLKGESGRSDRERFVGAVGRFALHVERDTAHEERTACIWHL
jgi:hypothetical protein